MASQAVKDGSNRNADIHPAVPRDVHCHELPSFIETRRPGRAAQGVDVMKYSRSSLVESDNTIRPERHLQGKTFGMLKYEKGLAPTEIHVARDCDPPAGWCARLRTIAANLFRARRPRESQKRIMQLVGPRDSLLGSTMEL